MPNQPATPRRSIRVPDDLWAAATRKAAERGDSLSQVVRDALRRYVRGDE